MPTTNEWPLPDAARDFVIENRQRAREIDLQLGAFLEGVKVAAGIPRVAKLDPTTMRFRLPDDAG